METRELTFGEQAVGLTFNPGGNPEVDACKREFAGIVDRMHNLRNASENGHVIDRREPVSDAQVFVIPPNYCKPMEPRK